MFFRLHTDGTRTAIPLANSFAGPTPTACWIIGGGPSLSELPCDAIARSPVPRFCINLAGTRLIRPNLWTSYDPSARFHGSTYLDASILKFVHARRAMDLVPGTTFKVCDCPATFFFDRDTQRGFAEFLSQSHTGIVDWNDSLLQAVDIAFRLGFRRLYLAGCEMHLRPSAEQLSRASAAGVTYTPLETLDSFFRRCEEAGAQRDQLERLALPVQYHFDEEKPLRAAIQTDLHYFRVAQYLRLVRRSIALAGVEIVSVTPGSRLNDFFPFLAADEALREIAQTVGDPASEPTRGQYTATKSSGRAGLGPMRDFRPHHWRQGPGQRAERATRSSSSKSGDSRCVSSPAEMLAEQQRVLRERLRSAIAELPEVPVALDEIG